MTSHKLRGPINSLLSAQTLNRLKNMADIYSKKKRSAIMASVKQQRTAPEELVAQILKACGIRFRRNVCSLPGQPDFVIIASRAVVFVHGCFWHGHEKCGRGRPPNSNKAFWREKVARNRRRDGRVARTLRGMGWHVITLWQCRLRKREQVRKRLARLLGKA